MTSWLCYLLLSWCLLLSDVNNSASELELDYSLLGEQGGAVSLGAVDECFGYGCHAIIMGFPLDGTICLGTGASTSDVLSQVC